MTSELIKLIMIINFTEVCFNSNLGDCGELCYIQLRIYKNSEIIEIYKNMSNKNLREIKSPQIVWK